MAQDLIEKIRAAAQAKGVDPEVALSIARAESELNPNAKAKSSSASGLFQILNETWAGNKGAPGKQFDPDENIRVGTDIISQNVKSLKKFLGRDPSPKEVYAAHYFGATGAQKFLSAAPDTPAKQLFSEEILAANSNLQGKTAAQILAQLEGKLKIPTSNVPRETTVAKKEREPLPPSLPPMAQAEPTPAKATVMASALNAGGRNMPDIKSMPASYQAAFALSALADAQDEEDEKAYNENRETESEKLMREYKPVNHLAALDLSVKPITMKDGGEVDAEDRPDDIKYFSNVNKRKERGTTTESVMLGARTKAGEGSFVAGLNMANMSRDEKMQTARALMLAYTQQDPEGLGFSANVVKPQGAPAMANLMGSLPLGEGRVSAGVQGNQGYSLGYSQPLEGGQFNANLNVPRGTMGSPQLNLQYNKRFAGGGEAIKSAANDLLKFIDSQGLSVSDVVAAFGKRGVPWSTAFYSGDLNTDEDLELRARRMKNSTIDEPRSGDSGIVRRADGSPEEGERSVNRSYEEEEDVSKPFIGNPNISRQAGQARRNAAIQKANYGSEIANAQDAVRKGEAYQELERYLQSRNAVPDIKVTGYLPEGTHGLFSSDKTNVSTGRIKVNKNVPEMFMPATIAHEMTHAADRQMMQQAKEQGMFGKSNQFTEAYEKMVGKEGRNRTQLLRKRYPEFEEDNRYYRADPKELAAHAIGAYSGPAMQDSAPRHVDATAATELRILMDLAQRNVDKGPTGLAKIPAFFKRIGSYADGGEVDMEGQEIKFATGQPQTPVSAPLPPATRSAKELDAYIKALNPGAKLSYFPEGNNAYGYVSSKAPDILNIRKGLSPQADEEVKLHELEHSLGFRGGDPLGRSKVTMVDNNYKAYYMLGDWQQLSDFTKNMVNNREKLEKFFGRPLNDAYFKPEMLELVKKQQGDTSALFDEQSATLSALEQITGKSLTRDPEMKKLFPNPRVMSVYDALTGPRQTRLDPRDLPPSTPQPAYVYRDNPVTQFLHKNLLGDNFYPYHKPVRRADGGDAEPTAEELAAASTPAFIAQKSGIGRKAGPVSQALQSGQGYIEFLKGMTNVPQNIVGAPMDISNMIANVYGGGVEKPFMGSEYIKEGLRKKGLGFTPSTDPTLAAFYGAGDLGSNLVNPAGLTRAGVQAAGKTGEAARMLAQDFQQYNQNLAVPGASYAVRNKGTPFTMTYGRSGPWNSKFLVMDQAEQYVKSGVAITKDKGLNDWLLNRVTSYLRRDFATPDDQFVKAAEANQLLHFVNKPIKRTDLDPYYSRAVDLDLENMNLPIVRKTEGFKPKGEARTEYGQRVEDLTDASAWPIEIGDISSTLPALVPPNMRAMAKTNPSERLTELGTNIDKTLQFEDLASEMASMRSMPKTFSVYSQPAIKVPEEYMLTDEALVGLTLPQASNRVAKFRNWQEENRLKMASTALFKDPTINRTPAGNGSIWINLDDLQKNPNMLKLVQDVGCDGGWCTKGESLALNHGSGENRLSILMDSKGRPKAQMTITTSEPSADNFLMAMDDAEAAQFKAKYPDLPIYIESEVKSTPEYQKWESYNPPKTSITEIKGVYDKEDLWDEPYLKQIQDRIQSMDVEEVKDLDKIRMIQMPEYPNQLYNFFNPTFTQKMDLADNFGTVENGMRAVKDKALELNKGSQFVIGDKDNLGTLFDQATNLLVPTKQPMTDAEMKAMLQKRINPSKATGGMIERQPTDNRRYL